MKIKELTIKDLNEKKFVNINPIKEIILFSDDKWKKFVNDDSEDTIRSTDILFYINRVYPFGLSEPFENLLKKFMLTLDNFQTTLKFLCLLIKNKEFRNVMNDYRISIQNFQVYIEKKSFYLAFMEFRKMLEGILWMRKIINDNIVPEIITKVKYQELLNQINPKFGDTYSKFNLLFHYYDGETPVIGVNKIYNEKDYLYEYLNYIYSIVEIYQDEINSFINSFNNKTWKRYKIILKKVSDAWNSYGLKNNKINFSNKNNFFSNRTNFDKSQQETFTQLIIKYNPYKMQELKFSYISNIEKTIDKKSKIPEYKIIEGPFLYLDKLYENNFKKYIEILKPNLMKKNWYSNHFNNLKNYKKDLIFKTSREICVLLLEKEIKEGGSKDIAFLRSIFEDILFNTIIMKNAFYMLTCLISEFLSKKYNIKVKKINKKHCHILRDNRIIYNKEKISLQEKEKQIEIKTKLINWLKNIKKIIDKL